MITVKSLLEHASFFDGAIIRHGFVDYMRDYEVLVGGVNGLPGNQLYRYQFVGCVEAIYKTEIPPEPFNASISDQFVFAGPDYPENDNLEGFIWGVRYANAYPGLTYIENGDLAKEWSQRMKRTMHEVTIETEAYHLTLVFADFRYEFIGNEDNFSIPKMMPITPKKEDLTSDGGVT